MDFLIQPTVNEARSTAQFGIPPLVWSPVADRNTTITPTGSEEYPGAARLSRKISVLLVRDRDQSLPADAQVHIQLRVFNEEMDADGNVVRPAVYQTLATLTPDQLEWTRDFPIDPDRLSVYKEQTSEPYGAVCFGMFGVTNTVQD